ncbi:MAG: hypothetical protein K2G35_06860 [Duncaniella sp.]|nr:hypothetical protein [Duncaniella sp.]
MKHIGQILKKHIEDNHLKKGKIAEKAGITYNYLSAIFKQASCDAGLLERLYVAAGLNPGIVFDVPEPVSKNLSDINASTYLGNASVQISQNENLRELLAEKERMIAEKERTIQILMGNLTPANSGQ